LLLGGGAAAQEVVLHEYVKPPAGGAGRIVSGPPPAKVDPKQPPANPAAIRQDDKLLVAPHLAQPASASEVVHGQRGFAADRETEARPDYATQQDGTLHYSEVFNPSVVPFKRMSALDQVAPDYALTGAGRDLRTIAVGGATTADRDLFWGSMLVTLPADGGEVPIPSVAPDMRVLSYEAEPRAKLAFARDAADNFYVRAVDGASGQHRVVFLVDAPAVYFAATIPAGMTVGSVAQKRPAAALPERVRASATVMLGQLGIAPSTPLDVAVGRLVEYFRGFEAGLPPHETGDIYLDLARSRRGVCRHRAFAFMITANAAGIPARYVANEAHAFGEIWLPQSGWVRVDLGGASLELDVANAGDKTLYRPRAEDPFPKPRSYSEGYTRLRGAVDGLSRGQIAEGQGRAAPPPEGSAVEASSTDPVPAPAARKLERPKAPAPGKKTLQLAIDAVDKKGFRGDTVRILGHATGAPEGLRVDLYLAPAGSGGSGARMIGQTVVDRTGAFALAVELPADVSLGPNEVYAVTTGNAEYGPAISD
jgi:hypothetical protein